MKDDRIYLHHIAEAIEDIEHYTATGRGAFLADRMQQDAVIRKLEVIGEAVKQLSAHAKSTRTEIQWREIAGMRDKMIHEYFGVNLQLVWEVVEREMQELGSAVDSILQDMRSGD